MKVILKQDVRKLGKKGDVVEVAEGYARNYLIPRNLASEASEGKLKELAQMKKAEQRRQEQILQEAKEIKAELEKIEVKLTAKVGEGGKLFGAVSSKEIAEQLKKHHNLKIDKKKIELKSPIKSLGVHHITVKLHPKVQAELKVSVAEEK
ncbi:MAG: 50S ribosomal protein L9 [Desulfotomaculum sp.]|nr:50S ribosomal protein L9 [Desulfotomaculum sp.]